MEPTLKRGDGGYCDAAFGPNGEAYFGWWTRAGRTLTFEALDVAFNLETVPPVGLLQGRIAVTDTRRLGAIGRGGDDRPYLFTGSGWKEWVLPDLNGDGKPDRLFGDNAVAIRAVPGNRFEVAAVTTGGAWLIVADEAGTVLRKWPCNTSQGIAQFEDDLPVLMDARINKGKGIEVEGVALFKASAVGDWWAGECTVGGDHFRITRVGDPPLSFEVWRPHGLHQHFHVRDGVLLVTIRGKVSYCWRIAPPYPPHQPAIPPIPEEPAEPPPTADVPIPALQAFPRKLWIAPYFSHSERYGDTPMDRHVGNAVLVVEDEGDPLAMDRTLGRVNKLGVPMIVEGKRPSIATVNRVIAWYVKHEDDVPRARALPEKPVICYRDVETAAKWPSERPAWVTDRVWPAVQCYRKPSESLASFASRVGAMLERVKSYGRPMVLVPRFDDFNGASTIDAILECMPIYARWVHEFFVVGILPFSDRRGHGIAADARLRAWARAFLLAVPVRPNRFDWWTPEEAKMRDVLKNKLGQSVDLVALSPEEKRYLLERL